ncbi:MAG: MaoC family dehydratase N-terminal domain-containing protein [Dehalococcoidia bacterium]|nr:MaoC family dehydratase N-terminal domain-containing protein [Dehalococcoidia bacterium]
MSCGKTFLTEELKALIGTTGERVQACLWGIEKETLRKFTQAVMDPDPRYWDEEFARGTKFGELVTPGIFCTYLNKTPSSVEDPVTKGFRQNPVSDGFAIERGGRGSLPRVRSELVRILNAGNEIEVLQYPHLGDVVFSQAKIANIEERGGRDGSHMLIVTNETIFTNQKGEVLCITRGSAIHR